MSKTYREVGVVKAIYRYPVKSMRGITLNEAELYWNGLRGDRRYAFVQSEDKTYFPWLTGREIPPIISYAPFYLDPAEPLNAPVMVRTPTGQELAVDSQELKAELTELFGGELFLMHSARGNYDTAVISLISEATIGHIGKQIGQELDNRRFRPNLLIETFEQRPFEEEEWLNDVLEFGDAPEPPRIRLNRRNVRCMMVNLDPETTKQTPAVLREIVQNREQCLGVYGSTEVIGTIKVGDIIRISS